MGLGIHGVKGDGGLIAKNNNINSGGSGAAYLLAGSSLLPHRGKSLLPISVTKGAVCIFFSKKRACCRPKTGFPNGSLRMFDVVLVVTSVLCIFMKLEEHLSRKFKVTDK